MIEQARAGAPREICGLMGGSGDRVERLFPTTNVSHGNITYMIDPGEQFQIIHRLREESLELIGIYHSHPATIAYPSPTDCQLAFYPQVCYLIISLEKKEPVIRAFNMVDGVITEAVLNISND